MKLISFYEIQQWLDPTVRDTDVAKMTIVEAGVVADFEKEIGAKLVGVSAEIVYLDGGRNYLYLPHFNVSNVSVYEDTDRAFGSDTLLDSEDYQVYAERGVLRIGNLKKSDGDGISQLERYPAEWLFDDFFGGRQQFLSGRQVIKVQYDGGYSPASVVVGTDSKFYTCFISHTAASANKPITGANYSAYWVQGGADGATWTSGAAYSTGGLPEDLKLALLEQISYVWRRRNDPGLSSVTYPDGSVNKFQLKKFLSQVQVTLDAYRRTAI
jgi:hypothetical protein